MNKRLTLALSIVSMMALSAGCSNDNNGADEGKPNTPAETVEVGSGKTTSEEDVGQQNTQVTEPVKQVEKGQAETIDGIKQYGQKVTVKGKKMNVLVAGDGKETIVLLPGYGDVAPGLSYTNLIEELSKHYRVAVVEPFGYGLSDVTDDPRTIDNITEEIHEALQELGIKKYHLMGSDMAGIYALQYVNKYQDEVTSFAGLDTDTPSMNDDVTIHTGEMDKIAGVSGIPGVSEEVNEQYGLIAEKIAGNKNLMDEGERKNENYSVAKQYAFPKNLPVSFFLGRDTIENRKLFPSAANDWVEMHAALVEDSYYKEIYVVETNQLIHAAKYREITETLHAFLGSIPAV